VSRFGAFLRTQTILYGAGLRALRSANRVLDIDRDWLANRLPPRGEIEESLGDWGNVRILCDTGWATGSTQFWNRSALAEEPEMSTLFGQLAQESEVIIDGGANWGYYTLIAAKANPNSRVLSFEPNPHSASVLMRTITLNDLTNVDVYSLALSDTDGLLRLSIPSGGIDSGATTLEDAPKSKHGKLEEVLVPSRTLDSICHHMEYGSIDLIKLDTEGTEDLIIRGSHEVIDKYKPTMMAQCQRTSVRVTRP